VDYFTADLHLAHPRLASLRGFETVAAHDAAVTEFVKVFESSGC